MSRLDSFIRRLEAQRACLGLAAEMVRDVPGPVLELGLGNGRTYDHLRSLLPGRQIFAFDRQVAAHPDCIPDEAHMILGALPATLLTAAARIGAPAALAHSDVGAGDAVAGRALAEAIAPALDALMAPGGAVVSDQPFDIARWASVPLPPGIGAGRYFLYRVEAASVT